MPAAKTKANNKLSDGWCSVGFQTKRQADAIAGLDRIACVEVPWIEGQGLNSV